MEKIVSAEPVNLHKLVKSAPVLFFVYGTLKKAYGNNRCLGDAEFLGTAVTPPNYIMLGKGMPFPGVLPKGNTAIHGEVYRTSDPNIVHRVCGLESNSGIMGHPSNWYDLEPVETQWGTAYMFVWRKYGRKIDPTEVVKDGDWHR